MRVSEMYRLGQHQASLDFVDVDIRNDIPLFLDPQALRQIDTEWAQECVSGLQSFFSTVLSRIQADDDADAQSLLASLQEPNETHLGLSAGKSGGHGMGDGLAERIWDALRASQAVQTGLLEDLEDTALFIEHIGDDIISDITTNIIRGPLIRYTQQTGKYYGIPLEAGVVSGRIWDVGSRGWTQEYTELPITDYGPLLLVPKAIVRRSPAFNPGEYYNYYIVPFLQEQEFRAGSSLVQTLKNRRLRVTKKAVKGKYGSGKRVNLDVTVKHPHILEQYRSAKRRPQMPDGHAELAAFTEIAQPDWDALLNSVIAVQPGREGASKYHLAVEALLSALFYPALILPVRESKLHEGRKRLDIKYTNDATSGFFNWLHAVHKTASGYIVVECKNYGAELGNPEFDQLTGRFSSHRGQVGFLCYRGFGDKSDVIRRCRDAALDNRGYVIALDDSDLGKLVEHRKIGGLSFTYLHSRFAELI